MTNNDAKIKELLNVIDTKKKELGEKPRASWKTDGLFKILGNDFYTNINTVTEINKCVESVALLLTAKRSIDEASKLLNVTCPDFLWSGYSFEDWLHDFKLRASMISWDIGKKKLSTLESKLSDLRSETAKTFDAITSIMSELK